MDTGDAGVVVKLHTLAPASGMPRLDRPRTSTRKVVAFASRNALNCTVKSSRQMKRPSTEGWITKDISTLGRSIGWLKVMTTAPISAAAPTRTAWPTVGLAIYVDRLD